MQAETLYQYIDYPELLNDRSLEEIESLLQEFPYFQTARMLYIKNLKNQGSIKYDRELKKTAVWVTDRRKLFYLLDERVLLPINDDGPLVEKAPPIKNASNEEAIDFSKLQSITSFEEEGEVKLKEEPKDDELDRLIMAGSVNAGTFFDVEDSVDLDDFKKAFSKPETVEEKPEPPKEIQHRDSLIDSFINNQPKIKPIKVPETEEPGDLSVESSTVGNEVLTDTLAKIYLKQGLYEKAINAYEKLSLKYPEKNSYFADQIQKIKKLISNQ